MKRTTLLMAAVIVAAGATLALFMTSGSDDETATTAVTRSDATPVAAPTEPPAATEAAASVDETAAALDDTASSATTGRIELAQADLDAVAAAGFVEGQHYLRLSPTQPTSSSPDSVEVDEFFMHSCIHCYNLEPYVQAWLPDKPDYIEFVRVPTTWDAWRRLHAQAYYSAVALGKDEEMFLPFFREIHDRGNLLQTADELAEFFGRFDVSREDFESVFDSFAVNTRVNRADELGRRYRVDSTPTIIINGKYRTDVGMAGDYDKLFELIEALAAAELGK